MAKNKQLTMEMSSLKEQHTQLATQDSSGQEEPDGASLSLNAHDQVK